ncbi:hypothetical protein D9M71_586960 [compost metagenome]
MGEGLVAHGVDVRAAPWVVLVAGAEMRQYQVAHASGLGKACHLSGGAVAERAPGAFDHRLGEGGFVHQYIRTPGDGCQQRWFVVVPAHDHPLGRTRRAQVVVAVQQLPIERHGQPLGQLAPQRTTRYALGVQALDVQAWLRVDFGEYETHAGHPVRQLHGGHLQGLAAPCDQRFHGQQA